MKSRTCSKTIRNRINLLIDEAEKLSSAGHYKQARDKYWEAFDLIPHPPEDYIEATEIFLAIGETFLAQNNFEDALQALQDAVRSTGGLGDPYVHLRLGQAEYEMNDLPRAVDDLMRAYMGGDIGIFEDEDPKYLAFLKAEVARRGGTL